MLKTAMWRVLGRASPEAASSPFSTLAAAAWARSVTTLVSVALTWCGFAALIRGRLVFMRADLNAMFPVRLLSTAYYDLVVILPLAVAFLALMYLARNNLRRLKLLTRVWWWFAGAMVLLDAINVVVLRYLGAPFTYKWLYYSDFLRSLEARNAIFDALSWKLFAGALAVIIAFVAVALVIRTVIGLLIRMHVLSLRVFGVIVAVAAVFTLPITKWQIDQNRWSYSKIANPVAAFAESFAKRDAAPIFTMKTSVGAGDFEVAGARHPPAADQASPMTGKGRAAGIKNVLFFVFESTPAEYIDLYGSKYNATPELRKYEPQSLVFRNAYAHSPATNVSMVSLLTGTYPWISTKFVTESYPDLPLHSVSGEMKKQGARTAFFNSADLRFKTADKFLEHRSFDVLRDDRTIPCDKPINQAGSAETLLSAAWDGNGVDDDCTANALINWVNQDRDRPFFAVMWTMMTHFPYFAGTHPIDYGVSDARFNRYLNGLHAGDAALGKIIRSLDAAGRLDSTLIVVLGDHGEAFGRHGQYVHATKINEENVHIPLVFINRKLFHGQESATVAGMEDIAPTVIDLLALPQPADWQGRSLFAANRSPRTYFFTPWADLLFGYRDGNEKFIFNATADQYEAYDLAKDPLETQNLIDSMPGMKEKILERTAAWVQYQNRMIKGLASLDVAASK